MDILNIIKSSILSKSYLETVLSKEAQALLAYNENFVITKKNDFQNLIMTDSYMQALVGEAIVKKDKIDKTLGRNNDET
jgi:hypothetical protein